MAAMESTAAKSEGHAHQPDDHHQRAPHVAGEVEGVRLQRLAVVLPRHLPQVPRPPQVHRDRDAHHQEAPHVRLDVRLVRAQSLDRLPDDPRARHEQEERLHERGDVLDLPVAVAVLLVGRLRRDGDRDIGDDGRDQVQRGVGRLGEDAQAVGLDADAELEPREEDGGHHRAERGGLLLTDDVRGFHGPALESGERSAVRRGPRTLAEPGGASHCPLPEVSDPGLELGVGRAVTLHAP